MKSKNAICGILMLLLVSSTYAAPKMKMTTEVTEGITTPDRLETRPPVSLIVV